MAKNNTNWLLVIVIGLVALYLLAPGIFSGKETPPVNNNVPPAVQCLSTTTPDLDINVFDIENPGTAITTASSAAYRQVGTNAWTTFTPGTPITGLIVGAKYEVLLGAIATDSTDLFEGKYFVTDAIPCAESTVMDIGAYNPTAETALVATFYNANHDASGEGFTAGQTQNVYIVVAAANNQVFGNPFIETSGLTDNGAHSKKYPNVFCMQLNSTAWDAPEYVKVGGVDMDRVSTPVRLAGSATDTSYCYEAPVFMDSDTEITVRLNADDTAAPTVDDTAYIYAADFYINADTGMVAWGVENEEGSAVGTDAADTVALDFTA